MNRNLIDSFRLWFLLRSRKGDLPFQPGTTVNIKHESCPETVITIVQETDGKYLYLAYPREFKGYNIQLGDNLVCKIRNNENEFLIKSNINNINLTYPSFLRVYVDKMKTFKNKRRNERYYVNFDASVTIFNKSDNSVIKDNIKMYSKDLSLTGMYAVIPKKSIEEFGEEYMISARVNTRYNCSVCFEAEIIRIIKREYSNELALKITHMDQENKSILENIVNSLENEQTSKLTSYFVKKR